MPKIPTKRERKLAKARAKGAIQGKLEEKAKLFKSPKAIKAFLADRLEDMLKNVNGLELGAVLGLTIIVKKVVDTTPQIAASFAEFYGKDLPIWQRLLIQGPQAPLGFLAEEFYSGMGATVEAQPEILKWIFSFVVAFILIRHAGPIIGFLGDSIKGLGSFVSLFVPLKGG